jgi:hypothetical protein
MSCGSRSTRQNLKRDIRIPSDELGRFVERPVTESAPTMRKMFLLELFWRVPMGAAPLRDTVRNL